MSARIRHRWLTWLLPLIVLRAFVPAGFMVSLAGGELQMMLCSGAGPMAPQLPAAITAGDHSAHSHHAHHAEIATQASEHHDHDGSQAHENSICPFAATGTTSVVPATVVLVPEARVAAAHFDFLVDPELRSPPILIDRIRGPPLA